MKILILWSGAVVPAYRQFFLELSRHAHVRVLSPRTWKHGSREFTAAGANMGDCEIVEVTYLPRLSARYWVPALIWHLWSYRPRYLYVMDEMDRPSLAWHALCARLAWPPVRVVNYALQNLRSPGYYRWHHRLATRINQALISRSITASGEADAVLKANGFRKPTRVIPLWGSEAFFLPAAPDARAAFRRMHGIREHETVLFFAGSMVASKGLSLLAQVLPLFPDLRVFTAGNGPLAGTLPRSLPMQWRHLGALESDQLLRWYQAAEYVILPSLTMPDWKEQIGRSLIEGILCGCIAIGSDSGFIPELTLFPQATFAQGDAESLAALLSRLPLADAESVREAQRRNVEERFTSTAVARATWEFLAGTGSAAT